MFAENGVGVWENYLADRDLGVQVGPRYFGATPSRTTMNLGRQDRAVMAV